MVFIRKHLSKGKFYYSVVETFRENGKVRQRIVKYIGSETHYSSFLQSTINMQELINSEIENLSYSAPHELWKIANEIEIPKIFSHSFTKEWGVDAGIASTIIIFNFKVVKFKNSYTIF